MMSRNEPWCAETSLDETKWTQISNWPPWFTPRVPNPCDRSCHKSSDPCDRSRVGTRAAQQKTRLASVKLCVNSSSNRQWRSNSPMREKWRRDVSLIQRNQMSLCLKITNWVNVNYDVKNVVIARKEQNVKAKHKKHKIRKIVTLLRWIRLGLKKVIATIQKARNRKIRLKLRPLEAFLYF